MVDYHLWLACGIPPQIVATTFVATSERKRSLSLRHRAVVNATFQRHFPGTYTATHLYWKKVLRGAPVRMQ